MTSVVIHAKTAHIFISPVGFITYANDYLLAFDSYKPEVPFSPALYYLTCRSLELSFKAFLLINGIDRNKLKSRSFGHDLAALLRKSKELGLLDKLAISESEQEQVQKANTWYARKGFEYFELQNLVDGKDTLPDLNIVRDLAFRMIASLKPLCLDAAQKS